MCFEAPYYVGIVEIRHDGRLYAARHVFDAEPSNPEVYSFVLHGLDEVCRSMTVGVREDAANPNRRRRNPKRVQRDIRREMARAGSTSKAHDAMRQQIEGDKRRRRQRRRVDRQAERDRQWQIKREKARRKRKGR